MVNSKLVSKTKKVIPDLPKINLHDYFDRIVLVNLKRRSDRLASCRKELSEKGWPFRQPEIFQAIDGSIVPCPHAWKQGGGAWGCMASHRAILQSAIMDGVQNLLVLEDDLRLKKDFPQKVERFLQLVPSDADGLMLGGQHMAGPLKMKPGLVKCVNAQRTHAYSCKGRYLRELYATWCSPRSDVHCDWIMGPLHSSFNIYAPSEFLIGQNRTQSDICGRTNPTKFWNPPSGAEPIYVLNVPKHVVAQLRDHHVHTGYTRDAATDIDVGLLDVFTHQHPEARLRQWIDELQWECVSEDGMVLGIYHPQITASLVQRCWSGKVVDVTADNVQDALAQMRLGKIVVLDAPREVAVALGAHGWHRGHWRDPISEVDNGLRGWAEGTDDLGEIVNTLVKEAGTGVACLWYPGRISAEDVRACTQLEVVDIKAKSVEEALKQYG